jgi:hypothetical protein
MDKFILIVLIVIAILISIYFYKNEHLDTIPIIEISLSEGEIEKSINLENTPVDLNIFFDRSVYVISEKITVPVALNKNPITLESITEKYIKITIQNENNIDLQNIGLFLYEKNIFIFGEEIIKQGYILISEQQQNKISMIVNRILYDNNVIRLRVNTNGISKITIDTKQNNFTNSKEGLNYENSKIKIKEIHLTNGVICPSTRCQLNVEELKST